MKQITIDVIDEFQGRGETNEQTVFQLTRDEHGKYRIERSGATLLIYPEEGRARAGFNVLREKRST